MNTIKELIYGIALAACMSPFVVAAMAMGVPTV